MARNYNYTAQYFKLWPSMNLNNYLILDFSKESLRKKVHMIKGRRNLFNQTPND